MSVTIEDLQEEFTSPGPFAGASQLNVAEGIPFSFGKMSTVISFPNYFGKSAVYSGGD